MVLFETKHPLVRMRRLTINNLRHEKWYSTISHRRRDPGWQFVLIGVHSWFQVPQPKLNKTERKGRGVQKSNVVHQRVTKSQNRTSFSFPPRSAATFVAHFVVHVYRSRPLPVVPRVSPSTPRKMVLFETKSPRVKMRRLAINNLRREKWYSTILRIPRPAPALLSPLPPVHDPVFLDPQLSTLNPQPTNLSTILGSLQVIPGEYHQFQPAIFFPDRSSPNRTNLSTIISNSE